MKQPIKSKAILFTLLFTVIFAVTLIFATNSFATEEINEADTTPTATEEEAVIEDTPEALSETSETIEAAVTESAIQPNLDTVETPIGTSGMKLIGNRAADPTTDYSINETTHDISIKTDNWTLSGEATHPEAEGWRVSINCDFITIQDLTQQNNQTNICLSIDEDVSANTLTINIEGNNNVWTIAGSRNATFNGNGTLNVKGNFSDERATGIAGYVFFETGSVTIDGPQIISKNEIWASEKPSPCYLEDGDLNIISGKLISTQALDNPNVGYGLIVSGKISIGKDAELYCSGKVQAISPTLTNSYGDGANYKISENFLNYEQKSQANKAAKVVQIEFEPETYIYQIMLEDGVTPAKTVYKPSGNEPTPPTPPTPDPEQYNSAQTGDSPLAGIVMLIAVASGICFASVSIRRTSKNKA